jgi:alcohol dehydrogenase class IV
MWFFKSPEIIYGEDALSYLDELPGSRAFIVTDPVLHSLGFTERIAGHLRKAGMEVGYFAEVEPEPSLQTVRRGAAQLTAFAPDWIVGLGGGSAMDAAKAMWVLYERPDIEPDAIAPFLFLGLGRRARLLAIPTTAGTGAEATGALVLTDLSDGRKVSVISRETVPTLAVVDPSLTRELPQRITADTGLDVLVHAVEGYTCTFRNDFSDGLCLKALQLVFQYLPRAYADPHDMEAREHMANAATIAGLGFGNSLAGLAHAMGHAFGATFKIPHGRTVALFLPYVMEFTAALPAEVTRYPDLAHALRLPEANADAATATAAVIAAIRDLERRVEQPLSVAAMGIARERYETALDQMCVFAEGDGTITVNARIPERPELIRLFQYAYDGKRVDF